MLSKNEFEVLVLMADADSEISQSEISAKTGFSADTVNAVLKELCEKKFTDENKITASGLEALEPYKVRRAIFLAAGFGSRLVPITLNTPKPLVRVNGTRIIDTLLDAVVAAGIPEVVIVRGYLGEQFDQLLYKYSDIKFVENPLFNETNNISSAMCIKDLLQNAYVLESDLMLKNPSLIRKYEYETNFLGIPVEVTNDWCFETDSNGVITAQSVGGKNCHQMVGISYWDSKDGARLAVDLSDVYDSPGGKERYWEQTAVHYRKENYKVAVRECKFEDVIEIDTFNELKQIDKIYEL